MRWSSSLFSTYNGDVSLLIDQNISLLKTEIFQEMANYYFTL